MKLNGLKLGLNVYEIKTNAGIHPNVIIIYLLYLYFWIRRGLTILTHSLIPFD